MDKLWAPWRINYIKSTKTKSTACVFCEAVRPSGRKHVVFSTRHSVAVLNIYPYNNGHTLISPKRHVRDLSRLSDDEKLDLFRALDIARRALEDTMRPDGFNIGINISKAAGAGITGHVHVHIVPRWIGDTNFMPALCATKVISQSLSELHRQLQRALKKRKFREVHIDD